MLTSAGTVAPRINATVTSTNDGSGSATLSVLLPPGDYTWATQPTPAGWTGGTGSFTVPAAGSAQPVTTSGTLLPVQVPTVVSLTVGGTAVTSPVVATGLNGTARPGNTGDTSCLAPGIADRTGVDITRPGPNAVAFTGFGFQPSVQLDTVAGRAPDTAPRSVTLALAGGGPSLWSAPVTIPAGSTTATGPALILGAGTYALTGTPPAGDPFGVGTQTGIDPAASGTATVTLPYTAVMLTVTAQVGTTPQANSMITLTPATGSGPPPQLAASGVAVFRDLPAGTYTVTAQAGAGATLVRGTLTGQQFDTGVQAVTVTMVAVQ